jgi:hypothetical protein
MAHVLHLLAHVDHLPAHLLFILHFGVSAAHPLAHGLHPLAHLHHLLTRAALACALGSGPLLHASTHAPMHHLLAHARTRLRRRRLRCGGRGWRLLLCRGRLHHAGPSDKRGNDPSLYDKFHFKPL